MTTDEIDDVVHEATIAAGMLTPSMNSAIVAITVSYLVGFMRFIKL